nr:hypothetical protein [Tanacetum cinerariifolium]
MTRISQRITMDSQRVDLLMEDRIAHQETILIVEEEAYATREAHQTQLQLQGTLIQIQYQLHETRFQMQQAEIAELRETDRKHQAQLVETLRVMGDMRREMGDMQAELLVLREQPRRARQPGEDARVPDHHDASRDIDRPNIPPNNTNPNNMTPESVQAMIDQALLRNSTNGEGSHSSHEDNRRNVQTARPCFYADFMKCQPLNFKELKAWLFNPEVLKKKMTDKYCPQGEIKKLEIELWNLKTNKYISELPDNIYGSVKSSKPKTLDETIELANGFMDQKLRTYVERQTNNKKRRMIYPETTMVINNNTPRGRMLPRSSSNTNVVNTQRDNRAIPKGNVGNAERKGNASRDRDSNVITGTFRLNNRYASILFNTGVDRSFISTAFSSLIDIIPTPLGNSYDVEL